ncbi:Mth938-like domain-containing protein [Methylobacterium sp. NEAU K]|uniref:Mth938-like domain-containing protein n=1 Tax=Methylobacterium sp. NEAU K TaxID=3064946 RepID=UPI00273390B9|nr:MTH938/NDUFAF3 family protein [Methylobacterium sp. NEAU K]MDP4003538.1 MTH938/NDUFAF3 family protein [Methylobacterium sp. NEAU K]
MAERETALGFETGFVPGRHIIDTYGNGGFRFAGMSHRGSILLLPSGVRAWDVASVKAIDRTALRPVQAEAAGIELLLVGTGLDIAAIAPALRGWLKDFGVGLDVMQTGAAARTYNILVAENRKVAAALIAVD